MLSEAKHLNAPRSFSPGAPGPQDDSGLTIERLASAKPPLLARLTQSAPRGPTPAALLVGVLSVLLGACDGGGRFDFISMQMQDLSEQEPLISTFHPEQCFWVVDDDGFMNIALHYENIPLFGPLSGATIDLSFELDEPPAGGARTYALRARELRGRAEIGAVIHRFRSLNGVLSVWIDDDRRIRGRFRALVGQSIFTMLTGWRPAAPLLIVGEFDAVMNAARFAEINAASQVEDWARPARRKVPLHLDYGPLGRPTSRPATEMPEPSTPSTAPNGQATD